MVGIDHTRAPRVRRRTACALAFVMVLASTARPLRAQSALQWLASVDPPAGTDYVLGLTSKTEAFVFLTSRTQTFRAPLFIGIPWSFTILPDHGQPLTTDSRVAQPSSQILQFTGGRNQLITFDFDVLQATSIALLPASGPHRGLAVDGLGAQYVVNALGHGFKYLGTGTPTLTFGDDGSGAGDLSSTASALALGPAGLYVLDTGDSRIVVFEPATGAYKSSFPLLAPADPNALAVDASGRIYTADGIAGGTVYNAAGAIVHTFVAPGAAPIPAKGGNPSLTIDALGHLYLYDVTGIHVFATPVDTDADGVTDAADLCPNSAPGAIVNGSGCSIDQLVPCSGPADGGNWKNRGAYVSAVSKTAQSFVNEGLITDAQKDAIVKTASQSSCGTT